MLSSLQGGRQERDSLMTATGKREGLKPELIDTLNMTKSVEHDDLQKVPAEPSSEGLQEAGVGAEANACFGKGGKSEVESEPAELAARKLVATTVTQLTGAAAGAVQVAGGQASDEPRGANRSVFKPEEGITNNSANISQNEAYAATKAMLMRLMRAGAPCARELAIKASAAGRGVVSYNPIPPAAAPIVQPPPADCFWQEFECVRLTLCSAETRHEYERHKVVKLGSTHFSAAEEITESSRTALLLFDVDHKELLGVWKATQNIRGEIHWRVVRRLAPMAEAAFLASLAGAIFPELPPNDTSAMARGEDARLVLRVLTEHAAVAVAAKGGKEDASVAAADDSKAPPAQSARSAPAPPAQAVTSASVQPESLQSALVATTPDASAQAAPPAKAPAPSPVAVNAGTPMAPPAASSPGHAAATLHHLAAPPAPQTATSNGHPPSAALAAPPATADTAAPAPAAVPTIVFGAFDDAAIPVTAPALEQAAPASSGRVGAAAAGAPALPLMPPPRIAPPSASLIPARVIPPPPSGGAPPPPPPVYLPPVLMLQRQRQAAEAAAPASPAGAAPAVPAAVQVTGIHGLQGGSVPSRAPAAATAPLAPGATAALHVRVTPQQQPSQVPPAPAPGPRPPAPQPQTASTAGGMPTVPTQAHVAAVPIVPPPAPALAPRPVAAVVQGASALTRPSFLAAVQAPRLPPGQAAGGVAPPRPVAPQAAVRPILGQAAPQGPVAALQVAVPRPVAPAAATGPFVSASSQPPPTWSTLAQPPPLIPPPPPQQQQPSPALMPVEQPAGAQPARPASALSCPLCIERSSCWFLLGCKHMGPCEECCPTPEWVQTLYPVCMRCDKAVGAGQVLKARVS